MEKKHWIRIVAFCLTAVILLLAASEFLRVPSARTAVRIYGMEKEPENSLDVIIIGTSNVYTSWYAPLAYEKQGFTSNIISSESMPALVVPSAIREVRLRQEPDVYVIDLWCYAYTEERMRDEAALRRWIDLIPRNENWEQTIQEAVPEDQRVYYEKPFLKYHGNWVAVKRCADAAKEKAAIWRRGYSLTKGYSTQTNIYTGAPETKKYTVSKIGLEELQKTLDFCKEQGLTQVVFARFPEYYHLEDTKNLKEAVALIESYGYTYLNPWDHADVFSVDPGHDFYNAGHVNIYGAEKFTDFLAAYLSENFEIDTAHADEVTEEWETCASYNERVLAFLKEETDKKANKTRGYDRLLIK